MRGCVLGFGIECWLGLLLGVFVGLRGMGGGIWG